MFVYLFITLFIGFCGLNAAKVMSEGALRVAENRDSKIIKHYFLLALFVLVIAYSLRGKTGTDAAGYYYRNKIVFLRDLSLIDNIALRRDKLFAILEWGTSRCFRGSWPLSCVVYALFTYIPVLKVIRRNSEDYYISLLYYVMSLSAFSGYNGVKQALAFSFIIFAYYECFRKGKYFKYFFFMLVAYGFHSATMFVIPFHLLSKRKLKSPLTLFMLFCLLLAFIFLQNIWGNLIDAAEAVGQQHIADSYRVYSENGSSLLRLLVHVAPVLLAMIHYRSFTEQDPNNEGDLIIIICSTFFIMFGLKNQYFVRLASVVDCTSIILFPQIINSVGKNRKTIRSLMLILYFLYMILLLNHHDGNIYPYVPVWVSKAW